MPLSSTDPITHEEDRRLRWALLNGLRIGADRSPDGWVSGHTAKAAAIDFESGRPELLHDDPRALRLLRDLVRKGLTEERRSEEKARALLRGETPRPRHYDYRPTEKGARLLNADEPPDPDIWDMRA